jgi:hypothetical protein
MTTADPSTYDVDPGRAWIIFAGAMLALAGAANTVYGIAAVSNSHVFVRNAEYVAGSLKTWGWFLAIVGILQLLVAVGIWTATEWGRWGGVFAASVNMLILFVAVPANPTLAIILFFVDVVVIYGLLTYGGHDRDSLAEWS